MNESQLYEEIKNTAAYQTLVSSHQSWEEIFKYNVQLMVRGIKEFFEETHDYYFNNLDDPS